MFLPLTRDFQLSAVTEHVLHKCASTWEFYPRDCQECIALVLRCRKGTALVGFMLPVVFVLHPALLSSLLESFFLQTVFKYLWMQTSEVGQDQCKLQLLAAKYSSKA